MAGRLAAITLEGFMLPEQVWEDTGEGILSATPLAWTHAQVVVRLASSIDAGRPVEQPSMVACRYAKECR